MDSRTITPAQADQLRKIVGRQLDYLNRLCARIQVQRWPDDDPLALHAIRARDAMQAVNDAARGAGRRGGE